MPVSVTCIIMKKKGPADTFIPQAVCAIKVFKAKSRQRGKLYSVPLAGEDGLIMDAKVKCAQCNSFL